MNYELAKKLNDLDFPFYKRSEFNGKRDYFNINIGEPKLNQLSKIIFVPTLSELIEACEDKCNYSVGLHQFTKDSWEAGKVEWESIEGLYLNPHPTIRGKSPEEAVANLWLELNKK